MPAIVAAVSAGCVGHYRPASATWRMESVFSRADHAAFSRKGQATVRGQGFVKTRGGDVKTCAGEKVFLVPDTPYFREWLKHVSSGESIIGLDPAMNDYMRESIGDAGGNFEFTAVPPGAYVVATNIEWEVPGYCGPSYYCSPQRTGGIAAAQVIVPESGEVRVIATR